MAVGVALLVAVGVAAVHPAAGEPPAVERRVPRTVLAPVLPDLLVLDELGYVPTSKVGAELLFDVISTAYERSSIIVTTATDVASMGLLLALAGGVVQLSAVLLAQPLGEQQHLPDVLIAERPLVACG